MIPPKSRKSHGLVSIACHKELAASPMPCQNDDRNISPRLSMRSTYLLAPTSKRAVESGGVRGAS